jgi:hypothetical protein
MTDKVFVRCGLSSGRLFCSTSIASLVQVRAMSSRRSRTRMLDAMAICRHSAARSLHTSEVSMAVTPAAVLPGTPTSLGSAGFPTIEEALPDGPQAPPNRPRLRHRQGPPVTTVPAFLSLVAALASRGLRAVALLRAKARPCASGAIRAANGLQLYASCGSRRAPFPFISARAQRCARPRSSYRGKRAACAKSQ